MLYDLFDIGGKPKDAPALIADTGVVVTYGELAALMRYPGDVIGGRMDVGPGSCARKTLSFCKELPLPARSLVFCMCKNEPGAVIGYLGVMAAGGVPLLLSADLKEAQLAPFFEAYQPAYIWAPKDWTKAHGSILQNSVRDLEHAFVQTDANHDSKAVSLRQQIYDAYDYGLWTTGNAPYEMHPDLALLLATSGSTGDPKLVRLSRKNLIANAKSICGYLQLDAAERPITTLPMQYTYGLSIINSHLLAGAAVLMTTAGYVQRGFWEFFERQGATSFGGVPYTYEILKKIHLFQKKLPSLRSITQAGGKLSVSLQKEVAQWAQSQGVRFFVMYGQTEATARMGYLPPEMCLEKPGSIGIAIPGGRFWLADEDGQEISDLYEDSAKNDKDSDAEGTRDGYSEIGELVYEGDNVSLGYATCAKDLQPGDERGGVLYTGDLARRDADGCYYIVGRKKRFVKIFGVRVSLDACEQTLCEWYPGVELACAGRDDCLNIYIADGKKAFDDSSKNQPSQKTETQLSVPAAAERLADYLRLNRRAFHVISLAKIPKNDAGKVLYRELPGE